MLSHNDHMILLEISLFLIESKDTSRDVYILVIFTYAMYSEQIFTMANITVIDSVFHHYDRKWIRMWFKMLIGSCD